MVLIYNIGVRIYYYAVFLASFFNQKAKLWINGRKNQTFQKYPQSIWFHFASLGEFEQGRPVLEAFREKYPHHKVAITFFSPSGYEVRKNTPLADAVYYLPLDTADNAREFIEAINPQIAIFTKYEYWYHYFHELHQRNVPLYVVSAIFRSTQIFFRWYGDIHLKMLSYVTWFFIQDQLSRKILENIGKNNNTISGDTRFDRVWENTQQPKVIGFIDEFKNGQKIFIGGSTWPDDEKLIAPLVNQYRDWKFIIAPHEISEEKINYLISLLPTGSAIKYSQLKTTNHEPQTTNLISKSQVLIIDNIGMLSSLYQYGDMVYIGGGFGRGIHNTLEAAAFGLPVIFGPKYQKFKEAKDLVELKAGFSITNENELKAVVAGLADNEAQYQAACKTAKDYVKQSTGATKIIMDHITAATVL